MRRIIGTIGATLAVIAALATTATAQDRDQARTSYATVTSIMGADWEDDWFEDYEEGDQLDQDIFEAMSRTPSVGWMGEILAYIEQENLHRIGEVVTSLGSSFGQVRLSSPEGGEVLGSDS